MVILENISQKIQCLMEECVSVGITKEESASIIKSLTHYADERIKRKLINDMINYISFRKPLDKVSLEDVNKYMGYLKRKYCDITEQFEIQKNKELTKLELRHALKCVRNAMEFAYMADIAERLNEDSVFVSYTREPIKGKDNIMQFFSRQRDKVYDYGAYITLSLVRSTEDYHKSNSKIGDEFLMIKYANLPDDDDPRDPVFVEIDDYYIKKIEIKYDFPRHDIIS